MPSWVEWGVVKGLWVRTAVVLVTLVIVAVVVSKKKGSMLASALAGRLGVRSWVERKAIRVPAALIAGKELKPTKVVLVIWVNVPVVVSKRKISVLPSALPGLP